jgi:hypothetical protein
VQPDGTTMANQLATHMDRVHDMDLRVRAESAR